MQNLSTEIITHYATVEKENKKFPMTKDQADALRNILKTESTMKYITIANPKDPFWEPLWEWRAGGVRVEFIEANWEFAEAIYFCDFGIKHGYREDCECHKKFDMSPYIFQKKVFAQFPNVNYNRDITYSMRTMVLGK